MKFTNQNLKKLENLFKELQYVVRYEKGHFKSGYCIVEDKKIAVVNKFFDTEARINCLLDILSILRVNKEMLSDTSLKFYTLIKKETADSRNSKS